MNSCVRSASAEIAVHRGIDLRVGWLRRLRQQRGGLHDLPGLTVSALRNVVFLPRGLARVRAVRAEPFDGGDLLPGHHFHRGEATANRFAVLMHGAAATEADAASELRAGEIQLVTQVPKERHVAISIELADLSVDCQLDHTSPYDTRCSR